MIILVRFKPVNRNPEFLAGVENSRRYQEKTYQNSLLYFLLTNSLRVVLYFVLRRYAILINLSSVLIELGSDSVGARVVRWQLL